MSDVARRVWSSPFLVGAGAVALAVAVAAAVAAVDPAAGDVRVALAVAALPVALSAAGVVLLLGALARRARQGRLRALSRRVRDALPEEFAVLSSYVPRDSGGGAVDLVVVGPTGVFAVEVCEAAGTVACYEDIWYRRLGTGAWRVERSPSRAARESAARLRSDVRSGGFVRTTVEALVLFQHARVAEIAGCSATVAEGVDELVDRLRRWNRAPLSDQRARAIARALSGTLGIAS